MEEKDACRRKQACKLREKLLTEYIFTCVLVRGELRHYLAKKGGGLEEMRKFDLLDVLSERRVNKQRRCIT